MKKFEITKEQILQLNSYNNYDCGVALKEWFPQAFESELEVGKWYIWKTTRDVLLFITNFEGDKLKGYGVENGLWFDNRNTFSYWGYKNDNVFEPATDKEVETALIAEAKKKYTLGCKIKKLDNFYYGSSNLIIDDLTNILYEKASNQLSIKDKKGFWICVFKDGKWAEIISEPIEVTLEEIAEKFNVNVEQLKIKK